MNPFDRKTNLIVIEQLRNTEKISIDNYIESVLIPLNQQNPSFCEILYKDIIYLLKGLDKEGDNDLMIKDGAFVKENEGYKLTGYQTRLHDLVVWLHTEVIEKIIMDSRDISIITEKIEKYEKEFLNNFNFTLEYKAELDKVKDSLMRERKSNHEKKGTGLSKYLDPEILEIKPNLFGITLNVNKLLSRYWKK